jgi:hypothetical protein
MDQHQGAGAYEMSEAAAKQGGPAFVTFILETGCAV